MASQVTACQGRKQFITPLKGASLCWLSFWLEMKLEHLARSFPHSFMISLVCSGSTLWTFSYCLHEAMWGLGPGPTAVVALSPLSLLLMESGTLHMNSLSPTKASSTPTKPKGAVLTVILQAGSSPLALGRAMEHRLEKPAALIWACHLRPN